MDLTLDAAYTSLSHLHLLSIWSLPTQTTGQLYPSVSLNLIHHETLQACATGKKDGAELGMNEQLQMDRTRFFVPVPMPV